MIFSFTHTKKALTIDIFKNKHQHIRNKHNKLCLERDRDLTLVETISGGGRLWCRCNLRYERERERERERDERKAVAVTTAT